MPLNAINNTLAQKELRLNNKIKNIDKKIQNNNNGFRKLLEDKINKDGSINKKKLNKEEKKLHKTCVELESFFWKQLMNSMKKTVGKFKLIDGGMGEEIFQDMLYDEYSMMLAKNANTHIADDMFKQLSTVLK